MDRCEHCGMPPGRHTSDCPETLAAKKQPKTVDRQIADDLGRWSSDPDVKLIIAATLRRHGARNIADLDDDVLADLHEAIGTMLEESPTNDTIGDPRRMV